MKAASIAAVAGWVSIAVSTASSEPEARPPNQEAPEAPPLVLAEVIDQATGEPITGFTVVPGVGPLSGIGWQWQPHKVHTFEVGPLRWPPQGKRAYRQEQVLRVEAVGYEPMLTPVIMPLDGGDEARPPRVTRPTVAGEAEIDAVWPSRDRVAEFTLRMRRDGGIAGVVLDAAGQPVAGAVVAAGMTQYRRPRFYRGHVWRRGDAEKLSPRDRWEQPFYTESDADGRFVLPSDIARGRVLASHAKGVAWTKIGRLPPTLELRLVPLGRIEGRCEWNDQPAGGEKLHLFATGHQDTATTNEEGSFVFDNVPPGDATIGRNSNPHGTSRYLCMDPTGHVKVAAGGVTRCVLGGRGRPVVGRVTGFDDWHQVSVSVHLKRLRPSFSFRDRDDPTIGAFHDFVGSAYYRHYDSEPVAIATDGSFRLDNVPAENWSVVATERNDDTVVRQGEAAFRIQMMPNGSSDKAQDIGPIEIAEDGHISYPEIRLRPRPTPSAETIKWLQLHKAKQAAE